MGNFTLSSVEMNTLVANRIKRFRKRQGYSQSQAGELIGMSQSAYSRMEKGETNSWTNHVDKICKHFNCTYNELLTPDDLHVAEPNRPIEEGEIRELVHDHPIQEKLLNIVEELRYEIKQLKKKINYLENE